MSSSGISIAASSVVVTQHISSAAVVSSSSSSNNNITSTNNTTDGINSGTRSSSNNLESRPVPIDINKLGFFKRLAAKMNVGSSGSYPHYYHSGNHRHHHHHHHHRSHQPNRVASSSGGNLSSDSKNVSRAFRPDDDKKMPGKPAPAVGTSLETKEECYPSGSCGIDALVDAAAVIDGVVVPTATEMMLNMTIQQNEHQHLCRSSHCRQPKNIMDWMMESDDCPNDVLPLILSFAGPKMVATMSRTSKFWRDVTREESTWRRLCEELYKWKEGDAVPVSWKKHYLYNPCVPVDFSSVHGALNNAIDQVNMLEDDTNTDDPAVTVRVLIQPGRRYVLREAVTIDEEVDSKISSVTIEAMEHYPEQFAVEAQDSSTAKKKRSSQGRRSGSDHQSLSPNRQSSSKRKRVSKSIMKIFKGCRTDDAIVTSSPTEEELSQADHHPEDDLDEEQRDHTTIVADDGQSLNPTERIASSVSNENGIVDIAELQKKPAPQATLVLRTRRHNEPLIRVRQGSCTIRNIKFKHMCSGTDIWNGNSAIQIQPPEEFGPNAHDEDTSNADWNMPTVTLDRVNVTSSSGRGIVNIDGGTLTIVNSYIHDCAATGIYVGGPGSRATIERSDILNNGQGNTISRRGIPRGHSGVYLEQGHATIVDCNISQNSLTGISAISSQNAHLNLEDSELVSNGTFQLEMPAASDGTAASISAATSRSSSIARNNRFATEGRFGRSRSGLF